MTNINTRSNTRDTAELLALHVGLTASVAELSSYIQAMLSSLRSLTQRNKQDLDFLSYLLALAELEARLLASRTFN